MLESSVTSYLEDSGIGHAFCKISQLLEQKVLQPYALPFLLLLRVALFVVLRCFWLTFFCVFSFLSIPAFLFFISFFLVFVLLIRFYASCRHVAFLLLFSAMKLGVFTCCCSATRQKLRRIKKVDRRKVKVAMMMR